MPKKHAHNAKVALTPRPRWRKKGPPPPAPAKAPKARKRPEPEKTETAAERRERRASEQRAWHRRKVEAGETRLGIWVPVERKEEVMKAVDRLRKKWEKESAGA